MSTTTDTTTPSKVDLELEQLRASVYQLPAGRKKPLTKAEREERATAHNKHAQSKLRFLAKSVTQGEWLAITRLLSMRREEIGEDNNLTLLALAWVLDKRKHTHANFDALLELTDTELLLLHGFLPEDDEDDEDD